MRRRWRKAARRRPIKTGIVGTKKVEILEGVTADSLVVADPPVGLRDGDYVHVRTPAAPGNAVAAQKK